MHLAISFENHSRILIYHMRWKFWTRIQLRICSIRTTHSRVNLVFKWHLFCVVVSCGRIEWLEIWRFNYPERPKNVYETTARAWKPYWSLEAVQEINMRLNLLLFRNFLFRHFIAFKNNIKKIYIKEKISTYAIFL